MPELALALGYRRLAKDVSDYVLLSSVEAVGATTRRSCRMAGFRTLRQRKAGPSPSEEVLPLTVLPFMRAPLLEWLQEWAKDDWTTLARMLKLDYTSRYPYEALVDAINADNDLLLDLVDARLKLGIPQWRMPESLVEVLLLAGSGWRVNEGRDGLEQVVDETVRAIVLHATSTPGSAGKHMASAWEETYGRARNPTQAQAEMIRAVESAARPVVTPNDSKATLGTLVGQLKAQGHLYTTTGQSAANDGVGAVVAIMEMLWQQQTDRHGANPTLPATQERVEFLVPIAAALVHVFASGAVRRK